jgi:integrase
MVSPDQYRALGAALASAETDREPWQVVAAVRLLALTGCRRGEIEGLRWGDVDLAGGCLRLSESKTGKSVRPLGSAAAAALKALPRNGQFVLPGSSAESHFTGLPKAWARLLKRAGEAAGDKGEEAASLAGLTPHGLRHGFASVAADLGLTEITISAMLGHSAATVTGRYIHHVDTALVAAADRVSARIAAAMSGEDAGAQVIPLRALG